MTDLTWNVRWWLLVLCLLVFGVVFIVMLGSMWWHHRRGAGEAANFHGSVAVEICWALAPCAIVVLMVWPTVRGFWGS